MFPYFCRELKNLQSKGSISLQEEKRVIKEISDIEKSLPYAGPLEELEEQSKDVKEMLKAAKQKVGQKSEVSKRLRDECRVIQEKIDKIREVNKRKRFCKLNMKRISIRRKKKQHQLLTK